MITHAIYNVAFTPASPAQVEKGCIGYLRFENGPFKFDGIQVRRSANLKLRLAFPTRVSANGTEYPLVRPTSQAARNEVETFLFRELQKLKVIP
jgi:hypothetical protein